mgnify:CR=1 FL=1
MELPRGTETVLVVDDETMVRELARDILKRYGYSVLTAAGGEEAVKLYQRHRGQVDAVVLDIQMPDVDGAEAFRRIRDIDPSARIILSSGYDQERSAEKLMHSGAAAFVQKPYRIAELLKAVRDVLDSRT